MDLYDKNLSAGLDHTVQEIGRTDTKAGLLLTVDGVLAASVTGLGALGHPGGLAVALVVVALLALVVAMLTGLWVVRPRVGPRDGNVDRASFVYWATASASEVEESLHRGDRVVRLRVLSGIAHRKMRLLRWSTHATAVAIVALAVAAAITAG